MIANDIPISTSAEEHLPTKILNGSFLFSHFYCCGAASDSEIIHKANKNNKCEQQRPTAHKT